MTSIMVSYSRKDSVAARKLINAFKELGLDVWVDWEDIPPAVGWLNQILRGIEESDAFIFLISPDSIASEICNEEIAHAGKNNKRIIPIVVRDVDAKTVNPIIRELNWIFAREQDVYEECLAKIKLAIDLDLEWVEEHRRLQVRALEWDRKKDISLLLRGRDLRYANQMVTSAKNKDPKPTDLQHIYIHHSRRDEKFRLATWVAIAFAVVILGMVSLGAYRQSRLEAANARLALENQRLAEENAAVAVEKAAIAQEKQKFAEEKEALALESENTAEGQRSAARAQIYQTRPGELYTSTLLAIDSWLRIKSPEAGEILRKNISLLPIPVEQMAQKGRINSLEFSPDGGTFVTASADKTACAWNVKDGKMLFCEDSPGSVNDAAFSPNGEIIAIGDEAGHVKILDAKNGAWQNEFLMVRNQDQTKIMLTLGEDETVSEVAANNSAAIRDISFNEKGTLLAIARDDGRIVMIDLANRKFGFQLYTSGSLRVSAFSPDGEWFAAGSDMGSVVLWNLSGSDRIFNAPFHKGEIVTLEFSPDGRKLISGGADGAAIVSRTNTGTELFRVLNEDRVEDVAFSPDGAWFVTVSADGRTRVWDADSRDERLRMLQDSRVTEVKVSGNSRWIATTGSDETIRLWDAVTGAEIFQIPLNGSGSGLAFSADENYLISGDEGGEISIWDLSRVTSPAGYLQFSGFTGHVQFSPTEDWLAASDENRVWKLDEAQFFTLTGRPQGRPIFESDHNVKKLFISPDSKWIGILLDSGDLVLYNVDSKSTRTMKLADPALNFTFSADGLELITAGADRKIQVRNLANGESPNTLYEASSSVMSLAVSKTLLAIGLTDQIIILDSTDGKILTEIDTEGDHTLMAFNADASLLASANSSGRIDIWKEGGEGFEPLPSITSAQIFSMTFSPQGDQLLAGAQDVLYGFDPLTGKEIRRIPHKDIVRGMSFSGDGKMLATTSYKVIQLWDFDAIPVVREDDLIKTACGRLIQNFDVAQWITFFPDETPKPLCPDLLMPE